VAEQGKPYVGRNIWSRPRIATDLSSSESNAPFQASDAFFACFVEAGCKRANKSELSDAQQVTVRPLTVGVRNSQ
jgi:hypothetical protein